MLHCIVVSLEMVPSKTPKQKHRSLRLFGTGVLASGLLVFKECKSSTISCRRRPGASQADPLLESELRMRMLAAYADMHVCKQPSLATWCVHSAAEVFVRAGQGGHSAFLIIARPSLQAGVSF